MDVSAIAWYAAICGALCAFAPTFGGRIARITIGAIVGILAASAFPFLRSTVGY